MKADQIRPGSRWRDTDGDIFEVATEVFESRGNQWVAGSWAASHPSDYPVTVRVSRFDRWTLIEPEPVFKPGDRVRSRAHAGEVLASWLLDDGDTAFVLTDSRSVVRVVSNGWVLVEDGEG